MVLNGRVQILQTVQVHECWRWNNYFFETRITIEKGKTRYTTLNSLRAFLRYLKMNGKRTPCHSFFLLHQVVETKTSITFWKLNNSKWMLYHYLHVKCALTYQTFARSHTPTWHRSSLASVLGHTGHWGGRTARTCISHPGTSWPSPCLKTRSEVSLLCNKIPLHPQTTLYSCMSKTTQWWVSQCNLMPDCNSFSPSRK